MVKKYVGQSIDIDKRLNVHLWEGNQITPKLVLEKAIKKYGIENFFIIKIQYPKAQLNEMERYYIDFFDSLVPSGYNLTTGGDSYEFSAKTKQKMKISHKGKKLSKSHSKNISLSLSNRRLSQKHIDKLKYNHKYNSNMGMKGKNHSKKSKESIGYKNRIRRIESSNLTEKMVLDIREVYKNRIDKKIIYYKYKNFISLSGLNHIIYNYTWKHLLQNQ